MLTAPWSILAVSVMYTWLCRDRHRGKTFPYDGHRLEIRSVEKADRGAAAAAVVVVADGERNTERSSGV